jgi:hypothetical protein
VLGDFARAAIDLASGADNQTLSPAIVSYREPKCRDNQKETKKSVRLGALMQEELDSYIRHPYDQFRWVSPSMFTARHCSLDYGTQLAEHTGKRRRRHPQGQLSSS